jgi:molecular chaperone IbpA
MLLQENVAMRTIDFTPFHRNTVGFDRLFDMLDAPAARSDWPPYNIEKHGDNEYRITMAIAGFNLDEVELVQHGPELTIVGQKKAEETGRQFLHHGLALRNFKHTFRVADHVKVARATLENGLLCVELVREVPEELKPRRIEIRSEAQPAKSEATQIREDIGGARQAA